MKTTNYCSDKFHAGLSDLYAFGLYFLQTKLGEVCGVDTE